MAKADIEKTVFDIAKPITDEVGVELVDVEFIKEVGNWYLRIYIDKQDGINIEDCENVSRKVDKILDEIDPIEQSYFLEVSSSGDRPIKKEADFERNKGKQVEVKLFKPFEGQKGFEGELIGLINGKVVIKAEDKEYQFEKQIVSLVKPIIKIE